MQRDAPSAHAPPSGACDRDPEGIELPGSGATRSPLSLRAWGFEVMSRSPSVLGGAVESAVRVVGKGNDGGMVR
jgi:hypothetical protein